MGHIGFTQQLISRSFDWKIVNQARAHCKQGAVLDWSFDIQGAKVLGRVRNSNRVNPYRIELCLIRSQEDEDLYIEGICACPRGGACWHTAAVAIMVAEDGQGVQDEVPTGDEQLASAAEDVQPASPRLFDVGSHYVSLWLERLAGSLDGAANSKTDESIIYIVDIDRRTNPPCLKMAPAVARRLKEGGYGTPREYSFRQLASSRSRHITDEDRSLARLFVVGASASAKGPASIADSLPDDSEIMDLLIRRAVLSGRCFFSSDLHTSLSLGPPRAGQLRWMTSANGSQIPELFLEEEGLDILYSASPWYLNKAENVVGPLQFDLAPGTVQIFCRAPAILPDSAGKVGQVLAQLASKYERYLPLPCTSVEQEICQDPPVPTLTLKHLQLKHGRLLEQGFVQSLNVAELAFDYGFDSNQLARDWEQYRFIKDNKAILRKRHSRFEHDCQQRLSGLGFVPIGGLNSNGNRNCQRFTLPSEESWLAFVQANLSELNRDGWRTALDETFQFRVVEVDAPWPANISDEGAGFWFSLDIGIELDGNRVPLLPILIGALDQMTEPGPGSIEKLNIDGKFYARLDDRTLLALPFERVRAILNVLVELFSKESLHSDGRLTISVPQMIGLLNSPQSSSLAFDIPNRLRALGTAVQGGEHLQPARQPAELNAQIRPYQAQGIAWLQLLAANQLGGVLADDMGLGKTLQTLAHILLEKESGRMTLPVLVVCPTSVIPNWISEVGKMAPSLRVLPLHGAQRSDRFNEINGADIVVTSYPLVVRDAESLLPVNWHAVVLDEAQAIKNARTKLAQTVLGLKAGHRICLTGTPIENHLGELWSQFNFLLPGVLSDQETFNRVFRKPIEEKGDEQRRCLLVARTKPFILRRMKEDVLPDLPEKTVVVKNIELLGDQRDLYESLRLSMHEQVLKQIDEMGLAKSQIVILNALLKLRQVCCDPRLVKLDAAEQVKGSAKFSFLMEMLDDFIKAGRRILLFSQFTSMLDLIAAQLDLTGIPYVQLRGDTDDRATPVARFQSGAVPLFLLSLKAGGSGLNLTSADTVIHYDPWWNPAVEKQATDRAHRIGQDKPVFVYKLIAAGTIEQRMVELQEKKQNIADSILLDGKAGGIQLNESDIESLFAPLDQEC
jgi:SNF2-related domain/Helicase conserved C-terminal domain